MYRNVNGRQPVEDADDDSNGNDDRLVRETNERAESTEPPQRPNEDRRQHLKDVYKRYVFEIVERSDDDLLKAPFAHGPRNVGDDDRCDDVDAIDANWHTVGRCKVVNDAVFEGLLESQAK